MEESNGLLVCFDATSSLAFSWLCRIIGGDFACASALLTQAYADLGSRQGDSGPFAEADVLASAYACAAAGTTGPADVAPAVLSLRDRALIDLSLVQHRGVADVALVLGLQQDGVPEALAGAVRAAEVAGVATSVVDLLRRGDHWLDDATRERCRTALARALRTTSSEPTAAGSQSATRPDQPISTRRRAIGWSTGAALAIVALVVWALPTTSSTPGATDVATSVHVVDSSGTPGFIATDLPTGFVPFASSNTGGGVNGEASVGVFQLWAQQGASRSNGKWFAVVSSTGGLPMSLRPETASRIDVKGDPGLYDVSADGIAEIMSERPGSFHAIDLIAHGFEKQELEFLAASVGRASAADVAPDSLLRYGPEFDLSAYGLELLVSARTWSADIRGQPVPAVQQDASYRNPTTGQRISIRTIPTTPAGDGRPALIANRFLLEPSVDASAPAEPNRTLLIGEQPMNVSSSTITRTPNPPIVINNVEWEHNDSTITVSGDVPLSDLIIVARSVKLASPTEWTALSAASTRSYRSVSGGSDANDSHSNFVALPAASTQRGDSWLASFGLGVDGLQLQLEHDLPDGSGSSQILPYDPYPLRPFRVYNSITSSLEIVTVSDPGSALGVRFHFSDGSSVSTDLTFVLASVGYAAAVAYTGAPPVAVDFVDANGAVVRTVVS